MDTNQVFGTSGEGGLGTTDEPTGGDHRGGSDRGRRSGGRSLSGNILLGLAIIFGGVTAAVMLLGALIVVGALFLGSGGLESAPLERSELPVVEGAPEADYVMVAIAKGVTGQTADRGLLQNASGPMAEDRRIESGSAELVAEFRSPFGVSELYRWSETPENPASGDPAWSCNGVYGPLGGSATCGEPDNGGAPLISAGSTTSNGETAYNLEVFSGLPDTVSWLMVDTESGLRVAATVIDGTTYLEWPSDGPVAARPTKATGLDASLNSVYSWSVDAE